MSVVEIVRNATALRTAMCYQKEGKLKLAKELLMGRYAVSSEINDEVYRSEELSRLLNRMKHAAGEIDRTALDRRADLMLLHAGRP